MGSQYNEAPNNKPEYRVLLPGAIKERKHGNKNKRGLPEVYSMVIMKLA